METTSLPFLLLKYIGAGRLIVSTENGIVIKHRREARKLDLSDDALLGVTKDSTRAYQEKSCAPFYV